MSKNKFIGRYGPREQVLHLMDSKDLHNVSMGLNSAFTNPSLTDDDVRALVNHPDHWVRANARIAAHARNLHDV